MQNRKMFQQYMAGLGELHGKELSKVVTEMYWRALSPFSDGQCKAAFDKSIAKHRFFPKPAELIEGMEIPNKYLAQQQATYLINAIEDRAYRNPDGWVDDPTTKRLLAGRFNVERIRQDSLETDHKWIEKNFIEAYNDTADYANLDEKIKIEAAPKVKQLVEGIG